MTLSEVDVLLKTTGFPVTYRAWPENEAPPLPFVCYVEAGSNNFAADGVVYYPVKRMQVELYTKLKDPETEGKVEAALSSFFWEKTETYLSTEKCYQILYEIEV
ncbi:hypothetical protein [Candidatus Allofournierella merdipullorum]|uniref:hypothetical protein n=1 Tax=Candidatus Allofournierella merdipullorum TaxID=2838595 RepID=UPI002A867DA8|nr:hypothetical protein [Candidatus Fournierella merdipullorum]